MPLEAAVHPLKAPVVRQFVRLEGETAAKSGDSGGITQRANFCVKVMFYH